jgi:hypothetical protein
LDEVLSFAGKRHPSAGTRYGRLRAKCFINFAPQCVQANDRAERKSIVRHVLIATAIAVHAIVVCEKKRHPAPRAPDAENRLAIQSGGSIAQESSVEPGNSWAAVRSSETQIVNTSPTAMR